LAGGFGAARRVAAGLTVRCRAGSAAADRVRGRAGEAEVDDLAAARVLAGAAAGALFVTRGAGFAGAALVGVGAATGDAGAGAMDSTETADSAGAAAV
jgi:hypothetical protein